MIKGSYEEGSILHMMEKLKEAVDNVDGEINKRNVEADRHRPKDGQSDQATA